MSAVRIPLAKPHFDEREVEAVRRVLASGWVVQGPEVEAFEAAIAQLHQARHCIAVSSGTAALHVCYLALGIGPGDAVFVPSFAWPSAANMALAVGARPVFVDVLPRTYNIDPADLRRRIGQCLEHNWGKPRAVVPVHEFGLAADMDAVLGIAAEHRLEVIEDAACALGATYRGRPVGTFGRLGIFSFHPRKAITTGEGGAIVTNEDALAELCRQWRNHGQTLCDGQRDFVLPGFNYRLTEIQAAIGRVQLAKYPEILAHRRELAARYLDLLADCPTITLPEPHPEHTWQTFMVVLDERLDRAAIIARLAEEGIEVGPGSVAGHCGKVYCERFGYQAGNLPQCALLHARGLALPLHSRLSHKRARDVAGRFLCASVSESSAVSEA
jgi:dTDP-4-amino-4,6-dideoxygalactose transaminase